MFLPKIFGNVNEFSKKFKYNQEPDKLLTGFCQCKHSLTIWLEEITGVVSFTS
jgi:hypothetical protein